MLKIKEGTEKLRRPDAGMLKRSSELENSACMKRLLK